MFFLLCLRRKQDPIVFALTVALLVVMHDILLQRSSQRRFSKQHQPRQTLSFDRPAPSVLRTSSNLDFYWQSKRIHASRLDQFSNVLACDRLLSLRRRRNAVATEFFDRSVLQKHTDKEFILN
jgi:hypothetical protein